VEDRTTCCEAGRTQPPSVVPIGGKWLLRRQASTPPQNERVILWVQQGEN